jgi:hypothetical protein
MFSIDAGDYRIINVKEKLLEGWFRTRGGKRSGIHISDLIHCKRAVAFNRLDENPPPPTERTLKFFIRGESYHRYLQDLLGEEFQVEKEIVWTCQNGIKVIGHCDGCMNRAGRGFATCVVYRQGRLLAELAELIPEDVEE